MEILPLLRGFDGQLSVSLWSKSLRTKGTMKPSSLPILALLLAFSNASPATPPPPPPATGAALGAADTIGSTAGSPPPEASKANPDTSKPSGADNSVKEQLDEMLLLKLKAYDPAQMAVCDDQIGADDIYSGLVILMLRVENELRDYALKNPAANMDKHFGLGSTKTTLKTLYGGLTPIAKLKKHSLTSKYIEQMDEIGGQMAAKAQAGFYDHRLMMKAVRLSMKMMANQMACQQIAFDIAKNRFGWPSKFVSKETPATKEVVSMELGMGSVGGVAPSTKDPNDQGSTPYSRWSGVFLDPKPEKWPWNGWPWQANNDPPILADKDKGTQGGGTKFDVPHANPAQ